MAELNDAADAVAEVAEEVADNATEVAEAARTLTPREVKFLLGGIGLGIICGGVAGYFITEKRLRTKYEQLLEEEVSEMRATFRKRLVAKETKPDLSAEARQYEEEVTPYGGGPNLGGRNAATEKEQEESDTAPGGVVSDRPPAHPAVGPQEKPDVEPPEEPHPEVGNVFEDHPSGEFPEEWDYEKEVGLRRPEYPYVIHVDERHEKEGYDEATFTYYEGDDVLCNEADEIVENRDKVVGDANLEKFGHGSGSPDVVYIRHDTLQLEFEVVKHDGKYAEVVHGLIQHSDDWTSGRSRRRPKFDDD